ncbi:PAS domain S-box protein [Peribacillus asahii]|uniref:HTH-type transcriptional regulatory protein TyrR n=1 Tax=Peribacillus asahii TaxID=228899 RepID=A0A398B3M0_9BACI|nr:sigma 54-interacting transcriptional regulator [Peribacillus asahii]RID84024.1 PAS domain S-box protein [Peribacillus asahii]
MNMLIKDMIMKTSIRVKENQYLKEVLTYFEQTDVNSLPVFNICNQLIGILTKDTVMIGIQNHENVVSNLHLDQDYMIVSENDHIQDIIKKQKKFYLVENKYKSIIGIISHNDLNYVHISTLERRLKELEAVFEHAHNGIVAIDKNGIITSFNPATEKISGVKREGALGRFLNDVFIPSGMLEVLRTGEPQYGTKYQVGNRKYISNRTPIIENDEVTGVVAVFQDISEIEKISGELQSVRELNQQLEAIIAASYDGIVITDSTGKIIRYNQAFLTFIQGDTNDNLNGKVIFEVFPSFKIENIKQMLEGKQSIALLKKTEDNVTLIITANPVFNKNEHIDFVVINIQNITKFIRLQEEVENNRRLTERYKEELEQYRVELKSRANFIADSPIMKKVVHIAKKVSAFDSTVMIFGESGTGKEELARIIQLNSVRSEGPFITINCGAIPETLLESELFGYEAGAFTGAGKSGKPGMFELAHNGIIFLDEIGECPLSIQIKLLRVIQEKVVTRLGGTKSIKIDVRILAATHRNLEEQVKKGEFREDLFFRLNVIPITLPPLRERTEDLLPLIEMCLNELNQTYGMSKQIASDAFEILFRYKWPGNIRELRNAIERSFVLSEGEYINVKDFSFLQSEMIEQDTEIDDEEILPLKEAVMNFENKLINRALKKYGSTYKAANILNVDQSTIVRKLQKMKT